MANDLPVEPTNPPHLDPKSKSITTSSTTLLQKIVKFFKKLFE